MADRSFAEKEKRQFKNDRSKFRRGKILNRKTDHVSNPVSAFEMELSALRPILKS